MSNIVFKQELITIPKELTPGEKYLVIFEFEGDPTEIAHIKPTCSCTADCKIVGNTIQADYTDQTSPNASKGLFEFKKNINVFFKNGKEVWVQNGMNKQLNSELPMKTISFQGKVRVI